MPPTESPPHTIATYPAVEVFACFLKLGLTSFGGPIAHLAYFRREFVGRRQWLSEHQYAQLLTLCQFLPGPASSQLGFALGMLRAGFAGALAAFVAFTLPSALLMLAVAAYLPSLSGALGQAVVHGLKLVAVAVVAHAVLGMSRQLCTDFPRKIIAILSAGIMLVWHAAWLQLWVVAFGAMAGLKYCHSARTPPDAHLPVRYGLLLGIGLLGLFTLLLLGLPLIASHDNVLLSASAAFYRAGALVFGGGHVVLPLLKESVVDSGWITTGDFLAGYGAAQALPGPMFSLAAYLGASLPGSSGGTLGAVVALLTIFLPGLLLISAALPLWHSIGRQPLAARVIAGINAAVVGLLAAALYDPVWLSGINDAADICIASIGLLLLGTGRISALWIVLWCVSASLASMYFLHT